MSNRKNCTCKRIALKNASHDYMYMYIVIIIHELLFIVLLSLDFSYAPYHNSSKRNYVLHHCRDVHPETQL